MGRPLHVQLHLLELSARKIISRLQFAFSLWQLGYQQHCRKLPWWVNSHLHPVTYVTVPVLLWDNFCDFLSSCCCVVIIIIVVLLLFVICSCCHHCWLLLSAILLFDGAVTVVAFIPVVVSVAVIGIWIWLWFWFNLEQNNSSYIEFPSRHMGIAQIKHAISISADHPYLLTGTWQSII